jgi:phospholipid transport system substrate-binding protein
MRRIVSLAFALTLSFAGVAPSAHAQAADPATQQIHAFDDALVNAMKQAAKLGPRGRFEALQPVIEKTFDLPAMTRYAVGSAWPTLPPDQQAELVRAFSRMTAATYAHNFDGYSGETFSIGKVDTRGPDKLVHTQLTGSGAPTELAYRMRQAEGAWKVIDVYYNGAVSSLLGQRSEYAATLASGGAPALVRKLNAHTDELLRSSH